MRLFIAAVLVLAGGAVGLQAPTAHAQLRIVTYNTNTSGTEGINPSLPSNFRVVRPSADIVFEAIGEETVNGIQRPADIILLQEQQQLDTTTQDLVDRLNTIYAGTGVTYARGFEVGDTTISSGFGTPSSIEIRQGVVYRTDTVELIDEDSFGNISVTNQPRETLLHRIRPIGYGPEADLFIFNVHFEAGDDRGFGRDLFARENEATDIRNYITSNGLGTSNLIVAGDLNVDSNFETSGVTNFGGLSSLQILAAGFAARGRVLDPLFPSGQNVTFNENASLADIHTQSPSDGSGPLAGGGIDDRFDFILQSDELLDGEGIASIPDSLRAFGNNGSTFNDEINDGNTIQIQGLTSFTTAQVLNALESASDHLPVVEDFQLPAILDASIAGFGGAVEQGAEAFLTLSVENVAPVDVPIGADELDYSVTLTGDTSFSASGSDLADGVADQFVIPLDTSIVGERSLTATVSTSSPDVPVDTLQFAFSYTVTAPLLPGDFNNDGTVDVADYSVWRDGFQSGEFTIEGYTQWRANFGASIPSVAAIGLTGSGSAGVPEPAAAGLLGLSLWLGVGARRRVLHARRARVKAG